MLLSTAARPRILRTSYVCASCLRRLSKIAGQKTRDTKQLPHSPARTRFAPSPTGYLHLGSLRTALYNYLLAKKTNGQFLLRIEDTDTKRTVAGAEERLYQDLRWAGLQWDEGPEVGGPYGPYKQSQRTPLYQEHAHQLLESGHAYRCFCTSERLHNLAVERSKLGLPTDYDRTCASIPKEESDDRAHKGERHVVRLFSPDRYPQFNDLVYGAVGKTQNLGRRTDDAFEDPILLKSDGLPTYHLANVVDDHLMKITHVVRGTEWLIATPKHLALYNAFGWEPPEFAHVGLLTNQYGQKLSKRDFDTDVASFRKAGILPEAIVNFVSLLGWSHRQRSDVMTLDGLVENFSLKFTKGNTVVDSSKLNFFQRKHRTSLISDPSSAFFRDTLHSLTAWYGAAPESYDEDILAGRSLEDYIASIMQADAKNFVDVNDFVIRNSYFFHPLPSFLDTPLPAHERPLLERVYKLLAEDTALLKDWTAPRLTEKLNEMGSQLAAEDVNRDEQATSGQSNEGHSRHINKSIHEVLRMTLAGGNTGPSSAHTMTLLGRHVVMDRLARVQRTMKIADGFERISEDGAAEGGGSTTTQDRILSRSRGRKMRSNNR